jgi:hypothetical protein
MERAAQHGGDIDLDPVRLEEVRRVVEVGKLLVSTLTRDELDRLVAEGDRISDQAGSNRDRKRQYLSPPALTGHNDHLE